MSRRAWATLIAVVAFIIAGSLYFLQASGAARPSAYGDIGLEVGRGRIELPDAGFALTAPPGWLAWDPSTGFQDWWGADQVVQLWLEPAGDDETWWMGTCGIGEQCTRERMVEAGGEAYCWVIDDTELAAEAGWNSSAVPAALTATSLAEQGGWTDIRTANVELPAGRASVVRGVDPNGWLQEMYYLNDGERWFRLICGVLESDVEPISVAETFEFLPASSEPAAAVRSTFRPHASELG